MRALGAGGRGAAQMCGQLRAWDWKREYVTRVMQPLNAERTWLVVFLFVDRNTCGPRHNVAMRSSAARHSTRASFCRNTAEHGAAVGNA